MLSDGVRSVSVVTELCDTPVNMLIFCFLLYYENTSRKSATCNFIMVTFITYGPTRMYRMILLSLLCGIMTYRVEAFVIPQSQRLIRQVAHSKSSNLGAVHFGSQEEYRPTSAVSSDSLRRDNAQRWHLFLSAPFSTIMRSTNKNSNPLLFASTHVVPNTQPPLLWMIAIGMILLQSWDQAFFTSTSILLQQLKSLYMLNLTANPCITKSITSGVIGICGDYMAQTLAHQLQDRKQNTGNNSNNNASLPITKPLSYDVRRGLGIMVGGVFISAPIMHFGYNLFERILPIHGTFTALAHMAADMLLLDSFFVASAFIVTGKMEGYSFRQHIIPQFRRDYTSTLKASWATSLMLMPLGFVCFRFLPVTLRTLFMNLTDVIWDAIVSFMTHRNRKNEDRIGTTANVALTYS